MHDGLGQELTGIALLLRGLANRTRREFPTAQADIDEIVGLVNHAISSTRALARGLSPVSLERGGLVPALRTLIDGVRDTFSVWISLRTRLRHVLELDESGSNHIYRIVQEALHNAVRHGRASRITVQFAADESTIRLSIRDNGRGLPSEPRESAGLGLKTIRYRAALLSGHAAIENHRQGGVVVRCLFPNASGQGGDSRPSGDSLA